VIKSLLIKTLKITKIEYFSEKIQNEEGGQKVGIRNVFKVKNKFITMAQMNVYFIGANDTHGLNK
jgi:hypothetical protein